MKEALDGRGANEPFDVAIIETLRRAVRTLAARYRFSAAESLVAHDVALGLCRQEIAVRRTRSERTIQSQIRGLLMKTDLRSTGDLRVRIFEAALIIAMQHRDMGQVHPLTRPVGPVNDCRVVWKQRKEGL